MLATTSRLILLLVRTRRAMAGGALAVPMDRNVYGWPLPWGKDGDFFISIVDVAVGFVVMV